MYVKFKINQDEIAKTICIQRKLANNTCNGHCELKKSLKKFEDNEKQMQNNLKEKQELVYIQHMIEDDFTLLKQGDITQKVFCSKEEKPISVSYSFFRPPSYFI